MMHFESLTSPYELQQELPATACQKDFIKQSRAVIKRILEGKDQRMLLIVGPCSIHDTSAAKEYAIRLKQLGEEVSDHFFIVMRSYFEKPRTTIGWKGLLYDPYLDGSHDIQTGLRYSRRFLLELATLEIPAATEFLDPISPHYFGDLISWGCVGARTTASQLHRQLASSLPIPIGFKNGTDGDLNIAVNAALVASQHHTFIGYGPLGQLGIVKAKGNADTHIVLRGSEKEPNYHPASIDLALKLLSRTGLPLRLVIDCSHDNSRKKHEEQPLAFQSAIEQILEGNSYIKGVMLESYLEAGNQALVNPTQLKYAISLTDPCLDWKTTENLILWANKKIANRKSSWDNREVQKVEHFINQ